MTTVGVTTSTAKDFVASNKIVVRTLVERDSGALVLGGDFENRIYTENLQALREFFRAEEDERLGRWRWPENPDYVVYILPDPVDKYGRRWRVIRESTGQTTSWNERAAMNVQAPDEFYRAAQDYFRAHPESKPWHDAKLGEVWELTVKEWGTRTDLFYVSERGAINAEKQITFEAIAPNYPVSYLGVKATVITAGEKKL